MKQRPACVILVLSIGVVVFLQFWLLISQKVVAPTVLDHRAFSSPQSKVTDGTTRTNLKELYDPSKYPVLPGPLPNRAIKVGIVTIHPLAGEAMHFLYDGVMESEYMELVGIKYLYGLNSNNASPTADIAIAPNSLDPSDAQIWIVDASRVAKLQREFLTRLLSDTTNDTAATSSWKVLLVDFTDRFQFQLRRYEKLQIWGSPHVRIAVRSIVQGRHYNTTGASIVKGRLAPNLQTKGGPMLHFPYAVRSDLVRVLRQESSSIMRTTVTTITNDPPPASTLDQLQDTLFKMSRPIDVLHLWQISFKGGGKSKYRNEVSRLVRSWTMTKKWNASIDEQGERYMTGRNSVDPLYPRAMMSSKIVIVTQKDDWEDHYRLFEAMVCGSLVIADRMVAPPKGLIHQETIIWFDNLDQLTSLVEFYLQHEEERVKIAQSGWNLAMTHHRSWHRLEEVLYGMPLTTAALRPTATKTKL